MPQSIRELLGRLRARERSLAFVWALARALVVCLVALVLSCAVDWGIDRFTEVPHSIHLVLLLTQAAIWLGALAFAVWPLFEARPDDQLALQVEEKVPDMGHLLISAVQLNRAGARTEGMSQELIAATTRKAEERAAAVDVTEVSEGKRYVWAGQLLAPVAAVVALLMLAMPATAGALLNRLFLGGADVPRRIQLTATATPVWPAGESGLLTFHVAGLTPNEQLQGIVRVAPSQGPAYLLPLVPGDQPDQYVAQVPAADGEFAYRAWLGDGRMKEPGAVRYSPRPLATSVEATALLPENLTDGESFEEPQKGGDIVFSVTGTRARVRIGTQTPIAECWIMVREKKGDWQRADAALTVSQDGLSAECVLALDPYSEAQYEAHMLCPYGFRNVEAKRRTITRVPLQPPQVRFLLEARYEIGDSGSREEYEIEGEPVAEGGRALLEYRAVAKYGIARARVRFRVAPPDALRNAVADVEKLHAEQEELKTATAGAQPSDLPEQAARQLELANALEVFREIGKEPLGAAATPLEKAHDSMKNAIQAIEKKDLKEAATAQQEALKHLLLARREFAERARYHILPLGVAGGVPTGEEFWTWSARLRTLVQKQADWLKKPQAATLEPLLSESYILRETPDAPAPVVQALSDMRAELLKARKALAGADQPEALNAARAALEHGQDALAATGFPNSEGGGRYDLLITGISDGKGGRVQVKKGDRIQYYVEVFSRAAPDGPAGASPLREKEVVDQDAFDAWAIQKDRLRDRTIRLEKEAREARPGQP